MYIPKDLSTLISKYSPSIHTCPFRTSWRRDVIPRKMGKKSTSAFLSRFFAPFPDSPFGSNAAKMPLIDTTESFQDGKSTSFHFQKVFFYFLGRRDMFLLSSNKWNRESRCERSDEMAQG
ncbi:hypothetical protein CDAR_605681 [Caerostris darwini]|uniref:Uncharacterized protein n=1 Tax=Caerostris darwini TaxID=1538125 RepID=A0AAV4V9Q8_9ARAC|nr:hypothetical protein CDAR_605681 [Caerostris darwini]